MKYDHAIGDIIDDVITGSVYAFHQTGSDGWKSLGKLTSNTSEAYISYGQSISATDNNILIGAELFTASGANNIELSM